MSPKKTKVIKYRLYAAKTDQSTVKTAFEAEWSRICGRYVLVYKRGKAPEGFKEIAGKAMEMLTDADRQWVQETNAGIMMRFAAEHEDAQRRGVRKFARRFEDELKAERKKMEDERNGTD